ncbi:hypothetical protein K5D56_26325 [Pseudomonas cichorii]|nr:hypothetical protein [Pseudomonas cichorii]MBX8556954.1 hypothetical protein [Pseudomonas cichorii]MBX8592894.1 hypothetical protein [Pseudomonas cichorii]
MDDFFDPLPLTEAQVAAGALPGESWAQARKRLESASLAAFRHSDLSAQEWQHVVELIDALQDVCVETLHQWQGDPDRLLLATVRGLFEYCVAREDERPVSLAVHQVGYAVGFFDEIYGYCARMSPREAKGLADSLIGLRDVLGVEDPYSELLTLKARGQLRMVLRWS